MASLLNAPSKFIEVYSRQETEREGDVCVSFCYRASSWTRSGNLKEIIWTGLNGSVYVRAVLRHTHGERERDMLVCLVLNVYS